MSPDSDCIAVVAPKICGTLLKNTISRNHKIVNKRLQFCAWKNVSSWSSSVTKHYGCKHARHCGLITNWHSQANQDFSCVRNMNCCAASEVVIFGWSLLGKWGIRVTTHRSKVSMFPELSSLFPVIQIQYSLTNLSYHSQPCSSAHQYQLRQICKDKTQ